MVIDGARNFKTTSKPSTPDSAGNVADNPRENRTSRFQIIVRFSHKIFCTLFRYERITIITCTSVVVVDARKRSVFAFRPRINNDLRKYYNGTSNRRVYGIYANRNRNAVYCHYICTPTDVWVYLPTIYLFFYNASTPPNRTHCQNIRKK